MSWRWEDEGYLACRSIGGDRYIAVAPLTFGRARVVLCTPEWVLDGW